MDVACTYHVLTSGVLQDRRNDEIPGSTKVGVESKACAVKAFPAEIDRHHESGSGK